jgi:hypothetical protein
MSKPCPFHSKQYPRVAQASCRVKIATAAALNRRGWPNLEDVEWGMSYDAAFQAGRTVMPMLIIRHKVKDYHVTSAGFLAVVHNA